MYYELATMTLPFGTAAQAATNVQAYTTGEHAGGELLGCWFTDIGVLNQMIVLRGFADLESLRAERERTQKSASPFGCGFQLFGQFGHAVLVAGQGCVAMARQVVGDEFEGIRQRFQHVPEAPGLSQAVDQHQRRAFAAAMQLERGGVERLGVPVIHFRTSSFGLWRGL